MTDDDLLVKIGTSLGRPLTDAETGQARLFLDYARVIIGRRLGLLSALDQDALAIVLVEAVVLKLKSPDGLRSTSKQVSVDDASVQTTAAYESATGQVTILDEWWSLLNPVALTNGAFSVSPVFEP